MILKCFLIRKHCKYPFIKRFNATSTASKNEDSFDKMYSNFKKALLYSSPLISAGILTAIVIYDVDIRKFIGKYVPFYVDFVRDKIGFPDDDIAERLRIQKIIECQNRVVRTSIKLSNSENAHEEIIENPLQSYEVFKNSVSQKYINENIDIIFMDDEPVNQPSEYTNHIQSNDAVDDRPSLSSSISYPSNQASLWEEPLLEHKLWNEVASLDEVKQLMVERTVYLISNAISNLPFLNPSLYPKLSWSLTPSISKAISTATKSEQRHDALAKIAVLQQDIAYLENEKLIGRREIDLIEKDILLKNREILALKRKYIYYFYFF